MKTVFVALLLSTFASASPVLDRQFEKGTKSKRACPDFSGDWIAECKDAKGDIVPRSIKITQFYCNAMVFEIKNYFSPEMPDSFKGFGSATTETYKDPINNFTYTERLEWEYGHPDVVQYVKTRLDHQSNLNPGPFPFPISYIWNSRFYLAGEYLNWDMQFESTAYLANGKMDKKTDSLTCKFTK